MLGFARAALFASKARLKVQIFAMEALLRPERPPAMIRLGSFYGGWWIPAVEPERGVAICVGAGTDVTFDVELRRLGYRVVTVDPTPHAVAWVEQQHPELELLPVGVWERSGELSFVQDATWTESWAVSETAAASAGTDRLVLPVLSVADLVRQVGATDVGVLKLDVEGAEHAVLASMVDDGIRPWCLCVEFDDHRLRPMLRTHRRLCRAGYRLIQIDQLNHVYVRNG